MIHVRSLLFGLDFFLFIWVNQSFLNSFIGWQIGAKRSYIFKEQYIIRNILQMRL